MLKSNGTDVSAERSTSLQQRWSKWILVKGFDRSHPEDDIKSGLRKLFSSCGQIRSVLVTEQNTGMRVACLCIDGEDAAEKALKLSGSDVGGWNAVVTTIPRRPIGQGFTARFLMSKKTAAKASDSSSSSEYESEDDSEDDSSSSDSEDDSSSSDSEDEKVINPIKMLKSNDTDVSAERSTSVQQRWSKWILVKGFDRSHPEDDIKSGLRKLFSSCGQISSVDVTEQHTGMRVAHLCIDGEDAAEKALKLSGSDVGGWNAVVTTRPRRPIGQGFTARFLMSKKPAANDSSSSDSEDEKESEDEIPAQKRRKIPYTETTIFAYNLSFQIKRSDVEEFFKEAGEVVNVRLATPKDDCMTKEIGLVEFSTAEEAKKALDLRGRPLLGLEIGLVLASEVTSGPLRQSRRNGRFHLSDGLSRQTVYVDGYDFWPPVDDIKRALSDHFSSCGEISKIALSIRRDFKCPEFSGGVAYIDFKEVAGLCKALKLDGSEMGGRALEVYRAPDVPLTDFVVVIK